MKLLLQSCDRQSLSGGWGEDSKGVVRCRVFHAHAPSGKVWGYGVMQMKFTENSGSYCFVCFSRFVLSYKCILLCALQNLPLYC